MEIKINKEIRKYQENLFFGLSMRQFICALLAVGVAVAAYFLLKGPLGDETVSWVCILCAAPIAAMGFFQYNGLTLERFIIAWVLSEFVNAGPRKYIAQNYYYTALLEGERQRAKQGKPKQQKKKERK